ncbi:LON peptidase substrate-binding domain-containing protein [Aquabacterium sp. OR-4]|uniref:LON peptidase substrate-binding domain-containing protein n=1 Tax=Aquabacterium sp. OR-4 TaxID=2978127 RepID=UPI0021B4A932|nr:LON peptidase substrate-binding domain-containing protein [Aquabacterium sp. OR-4]MDT7837294.1 LON peptidase substrate-binding domain-containing protein [Aquabacterium sp. OR-4]
MSGLPLFPLQMVLFPGGRLGLKVFEARYLDLMSRCLRSGAPFAVVCIHQGSEVQRAGEAPPRFESLGVLARLDELDAEQSGILRVQCQGTRRVQLATPEQQADGLWQAQATPLSDDPVLPVPDALVPSALALGQAIATLAAQGQKPFAAPYQLDQAGWVANRWCELLPLPLAARQQLMALPDPLARLQLVDEFLRSKKVI